MSDPVLPPSPRPSARPPAGPVSRRRYMVRRAGALGVLVALVATLAMGVSALGGGSEPTEASEGADATSSVVRTATSAPSTSVAADGSVAPPATELPDGTAKVLILGDSDAGAFGPYLMGLLDQAGPIESTLFYKVSSGLSRPDFYDWPADLRDRVPAEDPDVVVVTFGGNDAQDLLIDGAYRPVDTDEWRAEYGRRVGDAMDLLADGGRTVVWVGIPNAESADFTARLTVLRDVTMAEAAERADSVVYIDTWDRFDGLSGGYADYVIDPRDGKGKNVRAEDGFHLNITGAEILALDIARAVEDALREKGFAV